MIKNITPTQAARILNVSPQFVRIGLQRGILPIGTAVKMSSKWSYHISIGKLAEYMGCEVEVIEKEARACQ